MNAITRPTLRLVRPPPPAPGLFSETRQKMLAEFSELAFSSANPELLGQEVEATCRAMAALLALARPTS